MSIRFFTFKQAGLPTDSSDRIVWQFAQANQIILITANRNMKESDSLEQMIRQENIETSLAILTIGNPARFDERSYREKRAAPLVDILLDIENFMGEGRIFIPEKVMLPISRLKIYLMNCF